MLSSFPFDFDEYDMPMNVRPLTNEPVIEVTADYAQEIDQKRAILAEEYPYYCQAMNGTEAMQWETIEYLLPLMAERYPGHFTLTREGTHWIWTNRLLESETSFSFGDSSTLPAFPNEHADGPPLQIARVPNREVPGPEQDPRSIAGPTSELPAEPPIFFRPQEETTRPLNWLALQMQEDLLLMDGNGPRSPMVAGHLCFASSWCLDDKMAESFLDIHYAVPQFAERIARTADLMIQRLKPERPAGRMNWTVTTTDQLNLAPKLYHQWITSRRGITHQNAGERCYLRLERQTFSRLPRTNALLFTIHTSRTPLATVLADPQRLRRFTSVLKGMPRVTREYKGMVTYIDALIDYLEARCRVAGGLPATTIERTR